LAADEQANDSDDPAQEEKRRRFKELRKRHYSMKDSLLRCMGVVV
jgi:hypothetical protein